MTVLALAHVLLNAFHSLLTIDFAIDCVGNDPVQHSFKMKKEMEIQDDRTFDSM